MDKRAFIKEELGIIVSLSPQGDSVFAVIRRVGQKMYDFDGNTVYVGTSLFGNELGIEESQLLLAEILIPTDINPKTTHTDYQKLIGQRVTVKIKNDRPIMAHLIGGGEFEPRTVSRQDLYSARITNSAMSLKDNSAKDFLRKQGYSDSTINAIISEDLGSANILGQVISYGDNATYHKTSIKDNKTEADLSKSNASGIVKHLSLEKLKNRLCHIHPTALSAK
jgi:hypothetical protein